MLGSAVFRTGIAPGGALAGPWVRDPLWTRARAVPSLDLRFADNKSLVDAGTGAQLVTFTRASSGTFVGSAGVLQTAATDAPRFDHNPTTGESLGLLVEEPRTNSITNNTMVGAVAGTPGTPPTGWARTVTSNGITQNVAGVGVINGISYVDIRFQGTATGPGYADVVIGSATVVQNQTWTFSAYLAMVGGSTANLTAGNLVLYGSPSYSDNGIVSWLSTIGSNLTANSRFSSIRTFTNVTTNLADVRLSVSANAGATIDITIRIGLPQLEQGAFATSPILTSTATVTRAADVASITGSNFSSWYNQTEGTVFAEFSATTNGINNTGGNAFPFVYDIDSAGAPNSEHFLILSNGYGPGISHGVNVSGSSQATSLFATSLGNLTVKKTAAGYQENNFGFVLNAAAVQTDTSGTVPLTPDRFCIGNQNVSGNVFTGTIRRLTYWPTRFGGEVLQRISQP